MTLFFPSKPLVMQCRNVFGEQGYFVNIYIWGFWWWRTSDNLSWKAIKWSSGVNVILCSNTIGSSSCFGKVMRKRRNSNDWNDLWSGTIFRISDVGLFTTCAANVPFRKIKCNKFLLLLFNEASMKYLNTIRVWEQSDFSEDLYTRRVIKEMKWWGACPDKSYSEWNESWLLYMYQMPELCATSIPKSSDSRKGEQVTIRMCQTCSPLRKFGYKFRRVLHNRKPNINAWSFYAL